MSKSGYNRPQRRRNLRRGLTVFLVLICIFMLLADRQQKSMLASGRLTADDISAKIMGFIATPIRGLESVFTGVEKRKNAYRDNIALRAEVERLHGFENKVLDMEMRVRRFEDMLSIPTSSDISKKRIIARAVSESNGPFVHSALLNVGRNQSVEVGNAVMTMDGLYGHIVRAGSVSSRVLLLNDLASRISVMSQRSQSRAIMVGNNSDKPKLGFVSLDADWKNGDRVVTSGDGGVLPRGLQIGTIVITPDQELEVDLFYLNKPVDWVWILPFTPISPPEETGHDEQVPPKSLESETGETGQAGASGAEQ